MPAAATLHGVVFDILAARTFEGDFSNVTRSSAGKGTVRYAWERVLELHGRPAYEYSAGHLTALYCNLNNI